MFEHISSDLPELSLISPGYVFKAVCAEGVLARQDFMAFGQGLEADRALEDALDRHVRRIHGG